MNTQQFGDLFVAEENGFYSIHLSVEEGGWNKRRYKRLLQSCESGLKHVHGLLVAEVPVSAPRAHHHVLAKFGFQKVAQTEHPKTGELVTCYQRYNYGID